MHGVGYFGSDMYFKCTLNFLESLNNDDNVECVWNVYSL